MGNLQVRFLEGWTPAMAPGYSTIAGVATSRVRLAKVRGAPRTGEVHFEIDPRYYTYSTIKAPDKGEVGGSSPPRPTIQISVDPVRISIPCRAKMNDVAS